MNGFDFMLYFFIYPVSLCVILLLLGALRIKLSKTNITLENKLFGPVDKVYKGFENAKSELGDIFEIIKSNKTIKVSIWLVVIGIVAVLWINHDNNILQSGKYFIYVSPNDKTTVNYKLPADIDFIDGRYYVSTFYFPNGGSITFSESLYSEFGKKDLLIDDNGKDWYVELTKEKVIDKK